MAEQKRVLELVAEHSRSVVFHSEEPDGDLNSLKKAIQESFSDCVDLGRRPFFLQLKDEEWKGEFLDILPGDSITDKSVIKVQVY